MKRSAPSDKPEPPLPTWSPRWYVWTAAGFAHAIIAMVLHADPLASGVNLFMAAGWWLFLWIYAPSVPD